MQTNTTTRNTSLWHCVVETITGVHPQIKVDAYGFYISAACVSGHRKGGAR